MRCCQTHGIYSVIFFLSHSISNMLGWWLTWFAKYEVFPIELVCFLKLTLWIHKCYRHSQLGAYISFVFYDSVINKYLYIYTYICIWGQLPLAGHCQLAKWLS